MPAAVAVAAAADVGVAVNGGVVGTVAVGLRVLVGVSVSVDEEPVLKEPEGAPSTRNVPVELL